MAIKAIETTYRGYKFRSRLEAKWAIFFDKLGIKWEYEIEGYELPDGTRYLPDFWLPDFCGEKGCFVEVKPKKLTAAENSKATLLALSSETPVLLAVGTPAAMAYDMISPEADELGGHLGNACFCAKYLHGGRNGWEYRMFYYPGYENRDGSIDDEYMDELVLLAIEAARSARFEFGAKHPRV